MTLLFTDIVGSSKLWERHADSMEAALTAHDAIVRDAVERNNGAIFKNVGDACCCAFARPLDAVRAAVAAQRALRAHAWPTGIDAISVRMGVHSGDCAERGGDYVGPAVNRVARLSSIAYGDQILVSASTAALVRDELGAGLSLRELGTSRLKDLSRPEATFQVLAEGLRAQFPALAALDVAATNLPSPLSSFVGRQRELDELAVALGRTRLLTIAGPGGIGKTRLALKLAAGAGDFPDGVWFVDLTAARDAQFVAQYVATALHVQELPNEPIEATVAAHLREKRALLLVDNAEQVVAGVARLVKALLSNCPAVTVLTTSREPLHIAGESIYRVGPLVGDDTKLFLERAREAAPAAFHDRAEVPEVASLCRTLEGIPLAIELACARLSSMPLKQLARTLTSGLSLRSKDPTESARHRTLRNTIAWSYDLLAPQEQALCKALAVFRGGCDAEAAAAVANGVADVDEAAGSLADKSLLALDDVRDTVRYRVLEVVREYAFERLDAAEAADLARKHAAYYAARAGTDNASLDADVANVRAALEWTVRHDPAAIAAFMRKLVPYWRARGRLREARSWTSRTLAVETSGRDRALLLCIGASFASLQDDLTEALRCAREALALYGALGEFSGAAQARFRMAEAVHRQGDLENAERLYREALQGFTASREERGELLCFGNLGMLARQRGELRRACELLEEASRRADALDERRIGGDVCIAMGWVQLGLGDLRESRNLFEGAFAQKSEEDDRYGLCAARQGLATVALKEARLDDALAEFVGTLDAAGELQAKDYVARAFHGIAAVAASHGASEVAARFLGRADRLFEESGRRLRDSVAYDLANEKLDAVFSERERRALGDEGASMNVSDAIDQLEAAMHREGNRT